MSPRDRRQLLVIYAAAVIAGFIAYCAYVAWTRPVVHNSISCPTGQFDAGGFCRNEPTGCPNGDSIPLDSPKCDGLPDPNRPYYDAAGNKYDYQGNLISPAPTMNNLIPMEGK